LDGQREDGSWPIVTNLSVWNTTLTLHALAEAGFDRSNNRVRDAIRWLALQYREQRDIYSGRLSHGWSWTDLYGGIVDADDTSNAILALKNIDGLQSSEKEMTEGRISKGLEWLRSLQNPDGGWPTFYKGRGSLVFDRSCVDITSNAAKALFLSDGPTGSFEAAKGVSYIRGAQTEEGSWKPLWFGNEFTGSKTNSLYGTYKALDLLSVAGSIDSTSIHRALAWIVEQQNRDGGWGVGRNASSSPEETSFALLGLLSHEAFFQKSVKIRQAAVKGIEWLTECQNPDGSWDATPVGIYCEALWYHEKTYPIVYPLLALLRCRKRHV
jgi:squalene-hopene/tetraprenyl-beta-curcumene cyclase